MTERFSEDDMGTGIPAINGLSMRERVRRGEELDRIGTQFTDLKEGEAYIYEYSGGYWRLVILSGFFKSSWLRNDDGAYPLVAVEHLNLEGEVIEGTSGLLIGVDVCGDGNTPTDHIPPSGHRHIPLLIETIPSPDDPSARPRRLQCGTLE